MGLPLETGHVHIHYRSVDQISAEEHAQALRVLSVDEVQRAARFVFPRDRMMFVAAHQLLRQVLSQYESVAASAWSFEATSDGKPVLAERHRATNLRFNLAHTSGFVACVVCRGREVGIDVESLDPRIDCLEIASRFFSAREVTDLLACVESERRAQFVELWTLKEAYIKALGTGLSHPLHTFAFVYEGATSLRFEPNVRGEPSLWQFALFAPTARHRMAAAVRRSPGDTLEIATWSGFTTPGAQAVRTSAFACVDVEAGDPPP